MNEREDFEADAEPYGFSLERYNISLPTVEPWNEYKDDDTGHRWGGWQACAEQKDKEIAEIHKYYAGEAWNYAGEIAELKAELAKHQSSEFHPDWLMLEACQEPLREHMQMVKERDPKF